ncbi:MAG: T9SS type A sorting domain-containing protein, partial [Bacteroidota bacterium]
GDESVNVYPNPAQGVVNIQFNLAKRSPVKLRLHDAMGHVIHDEEAYFEAGSHVKVIDVKKSRASGLYIISVTTPAKTQSKKLVVE